MASDSKSENRAKWNEIHKAHLVKLLVEYNTPAYRSQNGWTKEAWNKMVRDMANKFGNPNITTNQIKALEQELKKTYKLLKGFSELSGFGWDYERHMVSAPDDVWAPLLERNKDARKWHRRPFPYFMALQEVYEGRYAEGKRSRGIEDYEDIHESPVNTPTPSVFPPNEQFQSSPIHETEDDDIMQVEAPCSQPRNMYTQSSSNEMLRGIEDQDGHRRKRDRKGKKPQDASFMDKYIAFRERENKEYLNVIKCTQVVEKHTIEDCMKVFNGMSGIFTKEELFKATQIFIKDKSYREVFLCLQEEHRANWLKMMFSQI